MRTATRPATPGAPRNGPAVLAGLVRCGRCGRRMVVRYAGPKRRPSYTCTRGSADYGEPLCQGLSNGEHPGRLGRRPTAGGGRGRPRWKRAWRRWRGWSGSGRELARQWQLRRERAAIEVDRAARQYQACEPENRLVARELERRWEEALRQQRQLDDEYDRFAAVGPGRVE